MATHTVDIRPPADGPHAAVRRMQDGQKLRLSRRGPSRAARPNPVADHRDPRWVLALRVSESLEGDVLRPEKRQRLIDLGRRLGLSAFDANLVIAIVQDQARRGHVPAMCPSAGADQLAMVPAMRQTPADRRKRLTLTAVSLVMMLAVEALGLWLLLHA